MVWYTYIHTYLHRYVCLCAHGCKTGGKWMIIHFRPGTVQSEQIKCKWAMTSCRSGAEVYMYICMYWWTYGRAFYKQMKANWTVKACLSTFIYPNDRESLSKRTHTSMELNWSKNIYVCMYKIKLRGILHMNEWRVNVWGGVRAYWSCYLLFINRCHTCKC